MENKKNRLKDDLSNYDSDEFDKPSVSVDVAMCSIIDDQLKALLIKRKFPPFRGQWALPGGFVNVQKQESLEQTAVSTMLKETNVDLKDIYVEQLKTYGDPDRDPRTRVITVVYFALLPSEKIESYKIAAFDDADEVRWFNLRRLPKDLGFDHKKILEELLQRLIGKISYVPIAFELVPEHYTWSDLQRVYEIVLGHKLLTPNFRRKLKDMYNIRETQGVKKNKEPGRPPVYVTLEGIKKVY